ncbi:MAG: hypothetical protein U9Q40_04540 [Campylobacterota bacterium]|nr:hypothetical protein [Campylobacterota bacterium]
MIIKYILPLTLSTYLFAIETIHSSISAYAESKNYTGSKQKEDGAVYGIGADLHYGNAEYKLTYEEGGANTVQPPMTKDLENQKIFFRYGYKFDKRFKINLNYAAVLKDNIAPTDGGIIGGGGFTYTFNKKLAFNLTGYFTDYDDFDVIQTDLRIDYKTKFDKVKVKFTSITKHINVELDDESAASPNYAQNARSKYTTTAIKAHAHYNTYHLGAAIYFGQRAFAIMQDGFKVQHHAMEFDRTYAIGGGKTFGPLVVRAQYIYQRATELPMSNEDVGVSTTRLIANYKF